MSRIYFHSETGTAEILGSERAWMDALSSNVGYSVVTAHTLRSMGEWLDIDIYGKSPRDFRLNSELDSNARLAMLVGMNGDRTLTYQGVALSPWDITLNTALRLGSRPVKLAARIHAQCEIHGWIDGPDRAWLADIIDEGLKSRALRGKVREDFDPRWSRLNKFLRADASEPVVMSYSVTDQFPSRDVAGWEGEPDDWYDLPAAEQWNTSMTALRARDGFLQIRPDDFDDYVFGHNGLTWMDIIEGENRLREVLGLEAETVEGIP